MGGLSNHCADVFKAPFLPNAWRVFCVKALEGRKAKCAVRAVQRLPRAGERDWVPKSGKSWSGVCSIRFSALVRWRARSRTNLSPKSW